MDPVIYAYKVLLVVFQISSSRTVVREARQKKGIVKVIRKPAMVGALLLHQPSIFPSQPRHTNSLTMGWIKTFFWRKYKLAFLG